MSNTTKSLRLTGQFANEVLGTFRIIRGFAPLQLLAEMSAPFEMASSNGSSPSIVGHQRAVDAEHASAIKAYLERGTTRFIPEIILSIRTQFKPVLDARSLVVGVESLGDSGLIVARTSKATNLHTISIERSELHRVVYDERRVRRIDGNHRLHHAGQLAIDEQSPNKYLAPFCAILLGPPDDPNDNYVESMLFHTINSTARPLDSEHALKLVLSQEARYRPPAEIEFATSASLHLTRHLHEWMEKLPPNQRSRLGQTPATALHATSMSIIRQNAAVSGSIEAMKSFAAELTDALIDVMSRLPEKHPELCRSEFFIELASLAWNETAGGSGDERARQATETLVAVGKWMGRDGFHQMQAKGSLAKQIFDIFIAMRSRIPKRVFLSRWYPVETDGVELQKANWRKSQIDRAIADLDVEGIHLKLDDPGTRAGATFGIHEDMYNAIQRDDIVLVDLSGVRPNVCIEAGYALQHRSRRRLLFLFQATGGTPNNLQAYAAAPFDLSTYRYEKITEAAEIPEKIKPHLREILNEAAEGRERA